MYTVEQQKLPTRNVLKLQILTDSIVKLLGGGGGGGG